MHSSVFEISRAPVPISERVRAGHLPDWFYEQVCDFAENPDLDRRRAAISQLSGQLGALCRLEGDRFNISPQIRAVYFHKSYGDFKAAAKTLSQTSYKEFSEYCADSVLLSALDRLNSSYEDKRGVYIYLTELSELITLDRWIRTADFSRPFYIGGTINYHYKILESEECKNVRKC